MKNGVKQTTIEGRTGHYGNVYVWHPTGAGREKHW